MTSARALVADAARRIAAAGIDTPRLDAELLLGATLGVSRERLAMDGERQVAPEHVERFEEAVRRRTQERIPIAYLLGRRNFRRIELTVDPAVLIPRPETELLVEVGLELPAGASVLDVGTGSGAVALALCEERPDLRVSASDVSANALRVARANALRLRLAVDFHEADLLEGLPDDFDAVLANLPYVASGEVATLAPELRSEPPGALDGGPDGLAPIRALVRQAGSRSIELLALEVGLGQAGAVARLLERSGFARTECRRDLAGIDRVVVGRR